MKKARDGNNDPISLDQLFDNSISSEGQTITTGVTGDKVEEATDEPLTAESSLPETGDDNNEIPLELLVSADSAPNDDLGPEESALGDPPSQRRTDRDSSVSELGDDLSYDGFLLPEEDISSNDDDSDLGSDKNGLDSDSADLASAYEATLSDNLSPSGKVEVLIQVASTYWKQDKDYKKAEQFFRKVRNLDPTNSTMLSFYRSFAEHLSNNDILINVLSAAINAALDKSVRFELTREFVSVACANDRLVDRSIQLWKNFLRDYPDDPGAIEELKRIFVRYQRWNNLITFINNQIKVLPSTAVEVRKKLYLEITQTFGDFPEYEKVVNEAYRLLYKLEPENKDVFDTLVGFYRSRGRWKNLIDLLITRSSVTKDVDEESECLLQSARLQIEKFKNYSAAEEPLTRLIALDRHALVAIEMLRSAYRHRREWQKLFDLLKTNLKRYQGEAKLEAVLEMSRTASSFSLSNTSAISLWQTVLELDPGNQEGINNLEKICDRAENWDALVESLDNAIIAITDTKQRVSLLAKTASIHSDKRKDVAAAINTWKQLLTIDPNHAKAFSCLKKAYVDTCDIGALEELFIQLDDYKGLFDSLNALTNKTKDVQVKTELLKRCADIQQNVLNNSGKATQLLEKILSYNPSDFDTLIRLLPIYHSRKQWKTFLSILDSALQVDKDYRYGFTDTDDLPALEKQAEMSQNWLVLIHLKQLRIDTLEVDYSERHKLLFSIASIFEEKLKQYDEAVPLYKELLGVSELRDTVIPRMLVLLDQDSVKYQIAEALYNQTENFSTELVSLKIFSILLEKPPPDLDRETLRRRYDQVIDLFIEEHRSDPRTLFSSLLALLKNNVSNTSIRDTLYDIAGQLKRYDKLVYTLTDIYNNSNLDHDSKLVYAEEIADIYHSHLGNADRAAHYYRIVFDRTPLRNDIFNKLESAYKKSANWNGLLQVYDVALKNEKDTKKIGCIANNIISTLDRARIGFDEQIYYLSKVHSLDSEIEGVIDKLVEAYRESADWNSLYDAVSTHLSRHAREDEKEKYILILADLCYRQLGNTDEAIKRHLSVLSTNPTCVDTQKFFEELLGDDKYKSKAIEILKTIYRRRSDVASYLRILELELTDQNRSDQERFSTAVEVSLLYDNHLNNIGAAFDYIAKAFILDPSNEEVRNRMGSYAVRAKKDKEYCAVIEREIKRLRGGDNNDTAVALLFEYAGYLSENGRTKKALAIYWKMIDLYSSDDAIVSRAINDINSIDAANYSPEDKIKLANIETKLERNPLKKKEILFRIARIQENEIGSLKDAQATIARILKLDGNDKDALQILSRIYESEKRWNDLIDVLNKLAAIETEPKIKRDIFIRISKLATHM